MESNPNLVKVRALVIPLSYLLMFFFLFEQTFTDFETKQSILTPNCDATCATAKICYMRSGSSGIANQNCAPGFGLQ